MDIPSLFMIPSAVSSGKVHSVFPNSTDADFDFARSSTATRVNSNGLIESVASGQARLNYEIEGGLVNTKPSLLLEPQSTNLITYSEDYSQSSWSKLNAQVSRTDETSPDGNNTNVFNLTGTNGNLFVGGTTGVEYTISVYIKSNNKNKDKFKLRLGNNISTEYEATDEWIRYVFTSTPTTGVLGITTSSSPDNEFDLLVWGFQLEQLSYSTSYIPTNGSTQTRAAETCNGAGTSSIFESSEGILYTEISVNGLPSSGFLILGLNDGGVSNNVFIEVGTNGLLTFFVISGGTNVASKVSSVNPLNNFVKCAIRYKLNDVSFWINGTEIHSDTSATMPVGLSQLDFDFGNGAHKFYGNVRDIRVYNTKEMTDSEVDILLTKITS